MISDYYSSDKETNKKFHTKAGKPEASLFETPLSVSQLNTLVHQLLATAFPTPIWVIGEVSKPTLHTSGHLYFRLKDADAEIDAVFFGWSSRKNQLPLISGDLWKCYGYVTLFEKSGKYQLQVIKVERAGEGALKAEFDKTKQKLIDEGYIRLNEAGMVDYSWKRPIPRFPQLVGIVSSPTAAGLKDMLTTIINRAPWINIILFPASVQGVKAVPEIISAIQTAEKHPEVDVIVITRGGGSIEDLWCFNDYQLAITVANCSKPVISAIGHEIDFTICDFVADRRAPTPTYAATILAPTTAEELHNQLTQSANRLSLILMKSFFNLEQNIDYLQERLTQRGLAKTFYNLDQKLSDINNRIVLGIKRAYDKAFTSVNRTFTVSSVYTVKRLLEKDEERLNNISNFLIRNITLRTSSIDHKLDLLEAKLVNNNPKLPMKRGFAIVRNESKQIVMEPKNAPIGSCISIELAKGKLEAEVIEEKQPKASKENIKKTNLQKEKKGDNTGLLRLEGKC